MAHIFMYEQFTGTRAKPGIDHDHLCRNRACCNPAHIELVTRQTNIKRVYRRRKKIDENGELTGGVCRHKPRL